MEVEYRAIKTEDKTNVEVEKPTHLRVSSVTLRIDCDEPIIVGAVEAGKVETVSLPNDADGNPRSAEIFVTQDKASASLLGEALEAVLPKSIREAIREALIQSAKNNGSLERIL